MDATDPLAIPVPSSDGEASGSGSQVGEPSLSQNMETIKSWHACLYIQIDSIRVDFALLKDDVHKVRKWVTTAEQRISAVEDDLTPLMLTVWEVVVDHKSQEAKLWDIEDRLRRNKLCFLVFPEGMEGKQPEEFLLSWLKIPLELTPLPICLPLNGHIACHSEPHRWGGFPDLCWPVSCTSTKLATCQNCFTIMIA